MMDFVVGDICYDIDGDLCVVEDISISRLNRHLVRMIACTCKEDHENLIGNEYRQNAEDLTLAKAREFLIEELPL